MGPPFYEGKSAVRRQSSRATVVGYRSYGPPVNPPVRAPSTSRVKGLGVRTRAPWWRAQRGAGAEATGTDLRAVEVRPIRPAEAPRWDVMVRARPEAGG